MCVCVCRCLCVCFRMWCQHVLVCVCRMCECMYVCVCACVCGSKPLCGCLGLFARMHPSLGGLPYKYLSPLSAPVLISGWRASSFPFKDSAKKNPCARCCAGCSEVSVIVKSFSSPASIRLPCLSVCAFGTNRNTDSDV